MTQSAPVKYPPELSVYQLDSVDSTNNYIKREMDRLLPHFPILVSARQQENGRGREQRIWSSPPDAGLYSSFGFRLETPKFLHLLALAAGVSVIETARYFEPQLPLGLKWPNDILSGGLKLAGVLIENSIFRDQAICVIGIGVNLNQTPSDFPPQIRERAVSLRMQTGRMFTPGEVNPVLAMRLMRNLERLANGEGEKIIHDANTYSQHLKCRKLSFHYQSQAITGHFLGIAEDGGLNLETADGARTVFYSGEIDPPPADVAQREKE